MPDYLKDVYNIKPFIGVPSDAEVIGIHNVVHAARNISEGEYTMDCYTKSGTKPRWLHVHVTNPTLNIVARFSHPPLSNHHLTMTCYPAEEVCEPPVLPPYLKAICDLQPIVGVPSDEEIIGVHAVVRVANQVVNGGSTHWQPIFCLTDPSFSTRHMRFNAPCWTIRAFIRCSDGQIPKQAFKEALPGEEIIKVQRIIKIYQKYTEVPSMFDPQLDAELSQHLFDLQMAKYMERRVSGQINHAHPGTSTSQFIVSAPAFQESNSKGPTLNDHNRTGNDFAQEYRQTQATLETQICHAMQQSNRLAKQANQLTERSNWLAEQSNRLVEQSNRPVEKLGDALEKINKVLVGIQHAIVRSHKGNTISALDCLVNEIGETPGISRVVDETSISWLSACQSGEPDCHLPVVIDGIAQDVYIDDLWLGDLLYFYGIGEGLCESKTSIKLKPGVEADARQSLYQSNQTRWNIAIWCGLEPAAQRSHSVDLFFRGVALASEAIRHHMAVIEPGTTHATRDSRDLFFFSHPPLYYVAGRCSHPAQEHPSRLGSPASPVGVADSGGPLSLTSPSQPISPFIPPFGTSLEPMTPNKLHICAQSHNSYHSLTAAPAQGQVDHQTLAMVNHSGWYPPGQLCSPPVLPHYFKSVYDLKPFIGVPSDTEVIGIHAVVHAAKKVSEIPSMHDPDLLMKLADHLFSAQMGRRLFLDATYTPPPLPVHISVSLETIVGAPSNEEMIKVQEALRSYQQFSHGMPTSQKGFVALSNFSWATRYMRCAGESEPSATFEGAASAESYQSAGMIPNMGEATTTGTNNPGTGGNHTWGTPTPQPTSSVDMHELIGRSNQLAERFNQIFERFNELTERNMQPDDQSSSLNKLFDQALERLERFAERTRQSNEQSDHLAQRFNQLIDQSNQLMGRLCTPVEKASELAGRSNELEDKTNQLLERFKEPLEQIGSSLKCINKVLVGVQHAIVRYDNTPSETSVLLPLRISGVSQNSHLYDYWLGFYLRFFNIGHELRVSAESRLLKDGMKKAAREELSDYLSSCLG
ncbi:laminin domain-containing protein [Rhizoctonia solani AG-1 IA]|uniref:Laminin domain-containing protein n=1 Tax=Thanatephorus cucumeris (strain AG1-IA) TaxID=983506 RepID=L8WN08_THACA|nr:laminin domain-containing protein [Rhizoctonia solani AG-1 IA]